MTQDEAIRKQLGQKIEKEKALPKCAYVFPYDRETFRINPGWYWNFVEYIFKTPNSIDKDRFATLCRETINYYKDTGHTRFREYAFTGPLTKIGPLIKSIREFFEKKVSKIWIMLLFPED